MLRSPLDPAVLAYVRTPDGSLASMHDAAFNPASNTAQASRLRLVNGWDADTEVTIAASTTRTRRPARTLS